MKRFFEKFDKSKFPRDDIVKNILVEMGIPRDRTDQYLMILRTNGQDAGFIQETTSGPFVAVGNARRSNNAIPKAEPQARHEIDSEAELPASLRTLVTPPAGETSARSEEPWDQPVRKVFISHGKNKKILEQVKEIVRYGKFEPIVAAEKETVSKPVPDKVMDDMRSCQAAVIHVASEGTLAGEDGVLHPRINENVLIEIGAAMALYRRRFVLLVEQGLSLPSNLQGLYEVRYEGDSLDGFSTMKLLKSFNDFSS
jgi:predicted nucleotide-binding protein